VSLPLPRLSCALVGLVTIAYVVSAQDLGPSAASVIDLIDLETGARTTIPHGDGSDLQPVWSPKGDRLAFVSDRDGNMEIYLYEPAKDVLRRITENVGRDANPAWSPDGRGLVLSSEAAGERGLYLMGADGSGMKRLTGSEGSDEYSAWKPDSTLIYFARARGIFTLDPDELGGATNLRGGDSRSPMGSPGRRVYGEGELPAAIRFLRPGGECRDLAWSLDGSLLAFAAERQGVFDLYVVTPEGERLRRITQAKGNAVEPTWHPDGLYLAYTLMTDEGAEIRRVNSDGSRDVPMIHTRPGDRDPAWSPDGATLAVVRPAG
jgi:Tol biopolymer transport system component